MKLQLTHGGGDAFFTGYGDGYVLVNHQRYEHHILVAPGQPVSRWTVAGFDALTADDFRALLAHSPEIVIFGAGDKLRFPPPALMRTLHDARVGLEVMDTRAACRTYNILLSEGRKVLAALLLE